MRLLHTSDILLGEDFSHCHAAAERARAARMATLRTLLALGKREECAAIIVAGNLWADNRVGQGLVDEAAALLSKSTVPIFLLPGHRDPLTADSPYELYPDRFAGKVKVLSSSEPLILKGGLTLLPFPVKSRSTAGDPTRSLPERDREPLRVAVLNSSAEGYRLSPGGLARRELDYLCAGGELDRKTDDGVHWCGTPEATDFGQQCGTASIVDLSAGKPAAVRHVSVASLEWKEVAATIDRPEQLEELATTWGSYENRSTTLLRLSLQGSLEVAGMVALEGLRRTLAARLLHLDLRNNIVPRLDVAGYRHPLLRALVTDLAEKAAEPSPASEGGLAEGEVAREALALLLKTLESSTHADLV